MNNTTSTVYFKKDNFLYVVNNQNDEFNELTNAYINCNKITEEYPNITDSSLANKILTLAPFCTTSFTIGLMALNCFPSTVLCGLNTCLLATPLGVDATASYLKQTAEDKLKEVFNNSFNNPNSNVSFSVVESKDPHTPIIHV